MVAAIAALDGVVFAGRFDGFGRPLEVVAPDGAMAVLQPWTYAAHLAALRDCVVAEPEGLVLDRARFAAHVLAASGLAPAAQGWLRPLALWWAAGGEEDALATADGPVDLGPARAQLRPWTEGERLSALGAALVRGGAAGDYLDAVGYLDAMVRRSLVALDPPLALAALDSRATARLLAATIALNIHDPAADPLLSGALPAAAVEATLGLCRALGWTPAQVLAAPAAEVQRLLALVGMPAPAAAPLPRATGLATLPDAVVFTFAEDAA